jgi:uncharacterized protein YbbC (DUF1343 family)
MGVPVVTLGIDALVDGDPPWAADARLGLLANQASVNGALRHSRELLMNRFDGRLTTLFSPQHGFYAEKQDNMVESDHCTDGLTGLPIYSLYGNTRRPEPWMMADIDVLLVDLQDVGTRVYTFIYTMAYCLEAAAQLGKQVIVLDRPNPIGGEKTEGNILRPDCRSFVGLYPLPMRHGLTIGEMARFMNQIGGINAHLDVVPMRGWRRTMYYEDTGLPWVFPSPNLPSVNSAVVYPGQVIWEGTTMSEGRGTTLPFELCGAPFWRHGEILDALDERDIEGCFLRPVTFEPTSGKWMGEQCVGFHFHVTNRSLFRPYRASLGLLRVIMMLYPEKFSYKQPPYEYNYKRLPLDLILGDEAIRQGLQQSVPVAEMEANWRSELNEFTAARDNYLLY